MIILINTSTPICRLTIVIEGDRFHKEWDAGRNLAKGLHAFISGFLDENGKSWQDIKSIGAFEGPGSFTGLRIGLTVMNTAADALNVPIVGGRGDNWQDEVLEKLKSGINEKIVLPFYGSEAHITIPKK